MKQNVTAVMTLSQVREASEALGSRPASYVSVFAGRIADTGRDPLPMMAAAVRDAAAFPAQQLIWASPREVLNIFHADAVGCPVITVTNDLLKKLPLLGKDLAEYSLETVKMFYDDACAAGLALPEIERVAAQRHRMTRREPPPHVSAVPCSMGFPTHAGKAGCQCRVLAGSWASIASPVRSSLRTG